MLVGVCSARGAFGGSRTAVPCRKRNFAWPCAVLYNIARQYNTALDSHSSHSVKGCIGDSGSTPNLQSLQFIAETYNWHPICGRYYEGAPKARPQSTTITLMPFHTGTACLATPLSAIAGFPPKFTSLTISSAASLPENIAPSIDARYFCFV